MKDKCDYCTIFDDIHFFDITPNDEFVFDISYNENDVKLGYRRVKICMWCRDNMIKHRQVFI